MEISIADGVLTAQVSQTGPDATVRICGDVCVVSAPRLRDLFDTLHEMGVDTVVLDLDGCTFLDSAGLSVLLGLRRQCALRGGGLVLRAPAAPVLRALAAAGALPLFRLEVGDTVPVQRVG